jgi:hypothetical protein
MKDFGHPLRSHVGPGGFGRQSSPSELRRQPSIRRWIRKLPVTVGVPALPGEASRILVTRPSWTTSCPRERYRSVARITEAAARVAGDPEGRAAAGGERRAGARTAPRRRTRPRTSPGGRPEAGSGVLWLPCRSSRPEAHGPLGHRPPRRRQEQGDGHRDQGPEQPPTRRTGPSALRAPSAPRRCWKVGGGRAPVARRPGSHRLRRPRRDVMAWDLGPRGLGLLAAMSLGFGLLGQLVAGRRGPSALVVPVRRRVT